MKAYLAEISEQYGYRANWEPTRVVSAGDVGEIQGGIFVPYTNLTELGITGQFRRRPNDLARTYSSKGGVKIVAKVTGDAPSEGSNFAKADGGLTIGFESANSFLFKASGGSNTMLMNNDHVGRAILELYMDGDWPKNRVIVSEIVSTDDCTIIISNSRNSVIELKANAEVDARIGLEQITVDMGFSVKSSRDISMQIVSQTKLTPLYRVMGIVKKPFKEPAYVTRSVIEVADIPHDQEQTREIEDLQDLLTAGLEDTQLRL